MILYSDRLVASGPMAAGIDESVGKNYRLPDHPNTVQDVTYQTTLSLKMLIWTISTNPFKKGSLQLNWPQFYNVRGSQLPERITSQCGNNGSRGVADIWVANGFTCRANIERSIGSLVELTLNVQFSEIEPKIKRSIFSLIKRPVTLHKYNKYIHRQFSHEKYISLQSFSTESGYWEQQLCLNTKNEWSQGDQIYQPWNPAFFYPES